MDSVFAIYIVQQTMLSCQIYILDIKSNYMAVISSSNTILYLYSLSLVIVTLVKVTLFCQPIYRREPREDNLVALSNITQGRSLFYFMKHLMQLVSPRFWPLQSMLAGPMYHATFLTSSLQEKIACNCIFRNERTVDCHRYIMHGLPV